MAHLFRVAAGLDSMVVGESEIQGQVRAAADRAAEEGLLGPLLAGVYRQAIAAGKRVRRETRVGAGATSVSSVAVDLARQRFEHLDDCRAVLIGAGRTAEGTARALLASGLRQLVVVNRTPSAARALAAHFAGRGVGFDSLREELRAADIVICSTDAPHRILRRGDIEAVMASREGRRLVVIDIAVPRDVEASAEAVPGVTLYDIDDLEQAAEANLNGRRREAERAERYDPRRAFALPGVAAGKSDRARHPSALGAGRSHPPTRARRARTAVRRTVHGGPPAT